ncbi:MAG: protein-methionine-sulfoxide reductase catalytic subunit MsrP [Verrucomicrobiota bacterium]
MPGDPRIKSSEITPEAVFNSRRVFMRSSLLAGSALATAGVYRAFGPRPKVENHGTVLATVAEEGLSLPVIGADEGPTPFEDVSGYNNYYEFSTSKGAVARRARDFVTRPWSVEVGGLAGKPRVFDLEELLKFPQVERVYRFRCVEGWSMIIPWVGFPLRDLLQKVEPLAAATHVAFQTYYDLKQMPDAGDAGIELPYVEGLRLDEALHPLTLLATGLYGKTLPNQNGAPIRLVVPWKYGFKSIKSVVKITLTDRQPPTTWNIAAPDEYGFYSNVNPDVDHPRWSQAREQRIGEITKRPTLPFNGYAEQVAGLYKGMDLRVKF